MIGIFETVEIFQFFINDASGLIAGIDVNMLRIAVLGSLFVGLAILAGFAVLRQTAMTYSAAFMIGTAAILEMFWLNFLQAPSANIIVLLQGIFGASVIIFLSSIIKIARNNVGLGGLMFAASLVFIGVGIINFVGRADFSILMVRSLLAVGVFSFLLSAMQSFKGDRGAQLVLPGTILSLGALITFITIGAGGLLAHILFASGILLAGLASLTYRYDVSGQLEQDNIAAAELGLGLAAGTAVGAVSGLKGAADAKSTKASQSFLDTQTSNKKLETPKQDTMASHKNKSGQCAVEQNGGRKPPMSSERLLEVLDFSGIAVWDWSLDGVYQSPSLCAALGSDCEAEFTPEAMRAFISPSHLSIFEEDVLGHGRNDGGFDTTICIHNGQVMRVRGARAIDSSGRLERVVAFFESPLTNSALNLAKEKQPAPSQEEVASAYSPAVPVPSFDKESRTEVDSIPGDQNPRDEDDISAKIAIEYRPMVAFASKEIIGYRAIRSSEGEVSTDEGGGANSSISIKSLIDHGAQLLSRELSAYENSNADSDNPNQRRVSSDAFIALRTTWEEVRKPDFFDDVHMSIRQNKLPYGALVLEMNGLAGIEDVKSAKTLFSQLRQAGARIAYADNDLSSKVLGNLHRYDFDYISVDQEIVSKIGTQSKSGRSAKSLLSLGRDLGIRVLASDIVDDSALKMLQDLGCHHGDGDALVNAALFYADINHDNSENVSKDSHSKDEHDHSKETLLKSEMSSSEGGISLDEWSANQTNQATKTHLDNHEPPGKEFVSSLKPENSKDAIPSIREAFVNSVPSFGPDTEQSLEDSSENSARSLPKWRTWVKQMR